MQRRFLRGFERDFKRRTGHAWYRLQHALVAGRDDSLARRESIDDVAAIAREKRATKRVSMLVGAGWIYAKERLISASVTSTTIVMQNSIEQLGRGSIFQWDAC